MMNREVQLRNLALEAGYLLLLLFSFPGLLTAQVDQVRLERVPPLSLSDAQDAIEVLPGFEVELVASEPLIADPIAMQFDERGRLIVVEMIDYSEQDRESLGRIARLSDRDSDGKMDFRETIVDGISWPTALAVTSRGILVVHPPYLTLYREMADGRFESEVLLEGFQRNNVQGMANSFRWGLDNRWHLSTSSNGARLTGPNLEKSVELFGRDLVLDPLNWRIQSEPGGGQHGMDFNVWGDKFVSSNSDHLQQIVAIDADRWTQGSISRAQSLRRSIAVDGPQADVFRISPIEAWRIARTQQRISGSVTGPIEGGGRAAGYFTGATGVFLFDGDQWGDDLEPTAIVADVGGNLVHRKSLQENGVAWSGHRIDVMTELMRSRDIWFRPVQFGDGPDGCLYVVDMCREVIEHPASLPPSIKSQLDLTSGRDRGRIWRLRRKDREIRRVHPPLQQMSIEQLCQQLKHPNGWHRETAARWIYENQISDCIPGLREISKKADLPQSRLASLSLLNGLEKGLDDETVFHALSDPHPRVVSACIYLLCDDSHANLRSSRMQSRLLELSHHASLHVRLAVAVAIPIWMERSSVPLERWLGLIQSDAQSIELREAIVWSVGDRADEFLLAALKNTGAPSTTPSPTPVRVDQIWVDRLLEQFWNSSGFARVFKLCRDEESRSSSSSHALDTAFAKLLLSRSTSLASEEVQELKEWIRRTHWPRLQERIQNGAMEGEDTEKLLRSTAILDSSERIGLLRQVLASRESRHVSSKAIEYWVREPETAEPAIEVFSELDLESRLQLTRKLVQSQPGVDLLLSVIEQGKLPKNAIPIDVWVSMLQSSSPQVANRAKSLRGDFSNAIWEKEAERYRAAWQKSSDVSRGRELFLKHCSACHRAGKYGKEIGPGLASVLSKSNEQIALAIAEPSREIDPKYQAVQLLTDSGLILTGVLESSSPSQYILLDAKGERVIVAREDVQEFNISEKSLMPDGLLEALDPVLLNDLIGFLRDPQ